MNGQTSNTLNALLHHVYGDNNVKKIAEHYLCDCSHYSYERQRLLRAEKLVIVHKRWWHDTEQLQRQQQNIESKLKSERAYYRCIKRALGATPETAYSAIEYIVKTLG